MSEEIAVMKGDVVTGAWRPALRGTRDLWQAARRLFCRPGVWLGCSIVALVAGASFPVRAAGYPGFGLNASRVVVMGDARGGTLVTALNNSTNVYLVQSRVLPADGLSGYPQYQAKSKVPFLVTPPLSRMEANSQLPLRILNMPGNGLPQDRESLFFLLSRAIPSVTPRDSKAGGGPQVVMALEQYVKLFYRPAGLSPTAIFDDAVAPALRFARVNGRLQVTNPTPYHITFGLLTVNGKSVDAAALRRMVPPMGQQDYPLPAGVTGGPVAWQIIDEFGLMPAKRTRALP
ncbi:molecular chaperone [Klebsiella aerogenes]|uniref:fimbrial biogenesis chaperone n=1 Tax=Klebsiella aerogenes TaxID=548 RepID=UPI002FFC7C98